jgi:hypothetical protein
VIVRIVATAAAIGAVSASGAGASPPRVLTVDITRAPIYALAQDGPHVAWATECDGLDVTVRPMRRGAPARFTRCGFGLAGDRRFFALAGRRVLWSVGSSGNSWYADALISSPGARIRPLGQFVHDNHDATGDYLGSAAGDGATLVFSRIEVGVDPGTCDENELNCTAVVTGGHLSRVAGGRATPVPSTPPAFLVAVSGRRVAAVVAYGRRLEPLATYGPNRPIEVRDTVTGRFLAAFTPEGTVRAVALAPSYVAVLVEGPDETRHVQLYALDGQALRATRVASRAADQLSASPWGVVVHDGKTIRLVDARSGAVRIVAVARSVPVGVSIESNRIVWAERWRGRSYIRALWL